MGCGQSWRLILATETLQNNLVTDDIVVRIDPITESTAGALKSSSEGIAIINDLIRGCQDRIGRSKFEVFVISLLVIIVVMFVISLLGIIIVMVIISLLVIRLVMSVTFILGSKVDMSVIFLIGPGRNGLGESYKPQSQEN
jgi:Flp pilus assembly protein TadB